MGALPCDDDVHFCQCQSDRTRMRTRARTGWLRIGAGLTVAALCAAGLTLTSNAEAAVLPYQDSSRPVAERVADLLSRMSLDDKIGQMVQAERAEVSPADLTRA